MPAKGMKTASIRNGLSRNPNACFRFKKSRPRKRSTRNLETQQWAKKSVNQVLIDWVGDSGQETGNTPEGLYAPQREAPIPHDHGPPEPKSSTHGQGAGERIPTQSKTPIRPGSTQVVNPRESIERWLL